MVSPTLTSIRFRSQKYSQKRCAKHTDCVFNFLFMKIFTKRQAEKTCTSLLKQHRHLAKSSSHNLCSSNGVYFRRTIYYNPFTHCQENILYKTYQKVLSPCWRAVKKHVVYVKINVLNMGQKIQRFSFELTKFWNSIIIKKAGFSLQIKYLAVHENN